MLKDIADCPHCRSVAILFSTSDVSFVRCTGCGMSGPQFLSEETKEKRERDIHAISTWNFLVGDIKFKN